MISRIEAYRYRCFQQLNLELGQHHVFAGSNGTGKTTLLDIPALLGDMISVTDINDAFFTAVNGRERARAEYAQELVHQLRGDYFMLAIEVDLPESIKEELMRGATNTWQRKFTNQKMRPDTLRYEVSITIANEKLRVNEEHLLLFPNNDFRPEDGMGLVGDDVSSARPWFVPLTRRWGEKVKFQAEFQTGKSSILEFGLRDHQLALSALPTDHDLYPAALWFHDYLLSSTFCYEPQWPVMRLAATPRNRDVFQADGSSLPWQVFDLQEEDPQGLLEWTELVHMALPCINSVIATKREDDGHCYLLVTYNNGMEVPSSSLSHGTLHILALTIIPYISIPPNVLTLEEPENGIHPKAIDTVLEALRLSGKTQLFMSTHSPIVLANSELKHIITMRINSDGATEVLKGSEHPRLKEWKGEVDLGTLFAAGVLE